MEPILQSDYPTSKTFHKEHGRGTRFVWSQKGEKDIFENEIYNESISIQRVSTKRMHDKTKKHYFLIIVEKDGKRMTNTDYLQTSVKEKMSIGGLEMFLGTRKSKIGLVDLGYKIPSELVLQRVFPHVRPMYAYFSPLDAIIELYSNHGFEIPEEHKKYLPSYNKEDML